MSKAIVPAEQNNLPAEVEDYEQSFSRKERCYVVVRPASELHRRPGKEQADIVLRQMPDCSKQGIKRCLAKTREGRRINKVIGMILCGSLLALFGGFTMAAWLLAWNLADILAAGMLSSLAGLFIAVRLSCAYEESSISKLKTKIMSGRPDEHGEIEAGGATLRQLVESSSFEPVELPLESVVLGLEDKSKAVRDYSLALLENLPQPMRDHVCEYFANCLSPYAVHALKRRDEGTKGHGSCNMNELECINWEVT